MEYKNICIIGAGAIGTALGNSLAVRADLTVILLSIEEEVVNSISREHINQKYFPNLRLNPRLMATTNEMVLEDAEIIFLAIPSVNTEEYVLKHRKRISEKAILVNLAKGFGSDNKTIAESLSKQSDLCVCSLKGPTFAREIINNIPTAFTLGAPDESFFHVFASVFKDTNIYLDYSTDLRGVEILSIIKNIYAIIMGIIDANFNSPNLRFLVLTKAFNEMRSIMIFEGGREDTMFNYCGIGDFGLTALNDLSRNRTLGLLIGKGFFTTDIPNKVVLEGKIAVNVFVDELRKKKMPAEKYFLMSELYKVFNEDYDISTFVSKVISR
ncbi:MAG: NAD(P)H-dependent glycerol-3-phosphate dehydrogenase [Bacteroidales bacterium]